MKRIAAAPLWFLVGWFVGSASGWAFGLDGILAPVVGVALATLIVVDPMNMIWGTSLWHRAENASLARRSRARLSQNPS